ncbi:MAG: Hsp20/alpha crystallin family protein [Gammaproteobacteria bacterium]|nr:Hsp20/alpha crystallin family protein [Gammaproteobacteria bacterium]
MNKNEQAVDKPVVKQQQVVVRPAVDIHEDEKGITLLADLPGVSNDNLSIEVDQDSLMIEGKVELDLPETMRMNVVNMRATLYRRGFTLSKELDTDKIEAVLKNGLLSLKIPKKAEVLPRKIEVRVA